MYYYFLVLFVGSFLQGGHSACYDAAVPEYEGMHVCISITEFKLLDEKVIPDEAKTFTCPEQTVCVDTDDICGDPTKVQASCDKPAKCEDCSEGAKYACISPTEFVPCSQGKMLSAFVQKCPTAKEYCGFGDSFDRTSAVYPCTVTETEQVCQTTEVETEAPVTTVKPEEPAITEKPVPSGVEACVDTIGAQAVATDTTCKSYFYCSSTNGVMSRVDYVCPGIYVFNPTTKRCVSPTLYKCPATTASG